MQLLDDDMDELFRNAASDYPLNTGGGDWEALQNKLQQADDNQSGTATGGQKRRWWFRPGLFGLITALLLIIAVKGLYNGERLHPGGEGTTLQRHGNQQSATDGDGNPTAYVQTTSHAVPDVATQETETKESKDVINGNPFIKENSVAANTRDQKDTREHVVRIDQQKVTVKTEQGTGEGTTRGDSEQSSVNRKTGNTVRASVLQDVPNSSYPAARPGITAVSNTPALSLESIHGSADKDLHPSLNILHANNNIRLPVSSQPEIAAAKKVKQTPDNLKQGLYYGLSLSPDISTVKGQRTSNVGYNVGLIAGYRFGKRLAVETGVIYERKYYYTDGKYFNPKTSPWPSGAMKILDVDGWCNMYEIPLNVRYTFAINNKSSWYVNGGIASYIMKKQGYNYSYEYYGNYGKRDWTYRKSTKDWLSNAHVGVGYERPAGVLGTLRVEPYVMIPVKGIGVGRLPTTSVGMNVGLTRPLRLK